MKTKVCILTTVHPPLDPRIFHKEALSLKSAGYDVTLVAPAGDDDIKEVKYKPVSKNSRRWRRFFVMDKEAIKKVIQEKPDIIHIHDPELIVRIPNLKKKTDAKIIFDIHEDVRSQIMKKDWIPKALRFFVSGVYGFLENRLLKWVDYIILAEKSYVDLYKKHKNKVVIRNKALVTRDFEIMANKEPVISYIGFVSPERGIYEMLKAVQVLKKERPNIKLELIGEYDLGVKKVIKEFGIEENVNVYGFVPIDKANIILRKSVLGLSLIKPSRNYSLSEPGKIFDYMNASIPVVASNITATKEIIEKAKCGKIVEPNNIQEIVKAINYFLNNPDIAQELGKRGRRYLIENYNWKTEEEKLLKVYESLV